MAINNITEASVKKKRGRKPKNYYLNNLNNDCELSNELCVENLLEKTASNMEDKIIVNDNSESKLQDVINNLETNLLEVKTIPNETEIKKKRGRKPKVKNEDKQILEKLPTEKKKRGRKPKIKEILPDQDIPKIPKKRGRKPKQQSINVTPNKNITFDNNTENIIVHLPIKTCSLKLNNKEDELFTYNPNLSSPKGYEDNIIGKNIDNCLFISQTDNKNNDELCGKGQTPSSNYVSYPFDEKHQDIIDILEDKSKTDELQKKNDKIINKNMTIEEKFDICHENKWYSSHDINFINNNKGVDKIMDHIKNQRQDELDNINFKSSKKNVEKCMIQMEQCNKTRSWPSSTSIYCWWCCHPFNGPPCALPCNLKDDVFSVIGIFCSPECAAAYNFDDTAGGHDLWERYSLLNYLYRKVYANNNIKIKLAPQKQCLKIFGGNLTIKEFRINNSNYQKTYKIIMPPMISIIPVQEVSDINDGYTSNDNKIYLIEKEKIDDGELKLKRNTPYNNKNNTLQKCMNISTN